MTTPPPPESFGEPSSDDKTMAQVAHIGLIIGFLPSLIIYLIKGEVPWVKAEAAKAFNFSIGLSIVSTIAWFGRLAFSFGDGGIVGGAISCVLCIVGLAAVLTQAIFGIMNGIKVSNGEQTQYPFEIPILK